MKKVIISITLTLIFSVFIFAQKGNNKIPSVALTNVKGEKVDLIDYAKNEKITVLTFWATWCAPCKKELNNIAEIYEDWQDDYDLEVIAISLDDQRSSSKVKSYVDGQRWEYDVLLDVNQDLYRKLNFQNVPYTIVIDPKGNIAYRHSGYVEGDEYELEEKLADIYEKFF